LADCVQFIQYEEMGERHLLFCYLPHQNPFRQHPKSPKVEEVEFLVTLEQTTPSFTIAKGKFIVSNSHGY